MLLGAHSPAGQREERVAFVTRFHGQLLKHGSLNRVAVDGREVGAVAVALERGHEGGGGSSEVVPRNAGEKGVGLDFGA